MEIGAGEVSELPEERIAEHLDKAENWLALAEGNRSELINLHEGVETYGEAADAQRWYFAIMLESAKDLAELHRAMAQTYWDCTPQQVAMSAPRLSVSETLFDLPRTETIVHQMPTTAWQADAAKTEAEIADVIRAQVKADAAEHAAVTLRPGTDPEPDGSEGDLWTFAEPDDGAGQWFWYAVNGHASPNPGDQHAERWLLVQHYAQVLRWQGEQRTKPLPHTWDEIGRDAGPVDGEAVLRRPTAAERTRFYGPEPDDVLAAEATAVSDNASPEGPIRFDATVQSFGDEGLEAMYQAVKRERTRRAYTAPEDRPRRNPRGGAEQWNG